MGLFFFQDHKSNVYGAKLRQPLELANLKIAELRWRGEEIVLNESHFAIPPRGIHLPHALSAGTIAGSQRFLPGGEENPVLLLHSLS